MPKKKNEKKNHYFVTPGKGMIQNNDHNNIMQEALEKIWKYLNEVKTPYSLLTNLTKQTLHSYLDDIYTSTISYLNNE